MVGFWIPWWMTRLNALHIDHYTSWSVFSWRCIILKVCLCKAYRVYVFLSCVFWLGLGSAFCVFHTQCFVFSGSRVLFIGLTSTFLIKTTLKLSPTVLFTYLKIILLQCFSFQFSIFSNKRYLNRPLMCIWKACFVLPSGTFFSLVGLVHCSRDPQTSFFQQNKH